MSDAPIARAKKRRPVPWRGRMRVKDARQTFVGLCIRQLLENKPIEVWGGKQLRDFTDVEDAVDAFLLAATNPATKGQVYNLGGSEVMELAGLAQLMVETHGSGRYSVSEFPAELSAMMEKAMELANVTRARAQEILG